VTVIQVSIDDLARRAIEDELLYSAAELRDGCETGGWLWAKQGAAWWRTEGLLVEAACGPGRKARRLPGALTSDSDHMDEWDRVMRKEGLEVVGAYHTHPGGDDAPSETDDEPVIDIALVVADSGDEPAYVAALEGIGYVLCIREPDWFEHRVLRSNAPRANLHVFSAGCEEVDRMTLFRDWLREDTADRELYERTKRDLAGKGWTYTQNYADAKTAVIEDILARAARRGRELVP
jgi:proteasome lid subunit RPN8/RPN11